MPSCGWSQPMRSVGIGPRFRRSTSGEATSRSTQRRVVGDRRDDQRVAEASGSVVLRRLDHADEREHELAVGQRMLAIGEQHGRQQVGRALHLRDAARCRGPRRCTSSAPGCSRSRRSAPRRARPPPDRRTARVRAASSSAARGAIAASFVASASAISRPVPGTQTPDALTHERPPLSATDAAIMSMCAPSRRARRRRGPPC